MLFNIIIALAAFLGTFVCSSPVAKFHDDGNETIVAYSEVANLSKIETSNDDIVQVKVGAELNNKGKF